MLSLIDQRAAALATAKTIVDRCKADGRDLSAKEQASFNVEIEKIDALDAQIKAAAPDMERLARLKSLTPAAKTGDALRLFNQSAKDGILTAVKTRTAYRTEVDAKAVTEGAMLPTSGTNAYGGLFPGAYPLAALFPNQPADGPSQRYYVFTGATADVTAEGAPKHDSGLTVAAKDAVLEKVTSLVRFSDELSDDAPYLIQHLQSELVSAVVTKENSQILAKWNSTSGILTATGTKASALDVLADAIGTAEAINGASPSVIVMNPVDLAVVRKAKASTGGDYFLDPLTATPPAVHGVQLVSSAVVASGTAWLASSPGVVIYRCGPITAEIGHDNDDFSTNMRTLRVEERFTTAVVRPSMLTKITLT